VPGELRRNYGVESVDELRSLSGMEMMAGHLRATDPRTVFERHRAEGPKRFAGVPEVIEFRWKLIGFAREGDNLVHGVFRVIWTNRLRVGPEWGAEVATARRSDHGWSLSRDLMWGIDRIYNALGHFVEDHDE
jgi:hypothetical protein